MSNKYTEARHAKGLIRCLELGLCKCCPKTKLTDTMGRTAYHKTIKLSLEQSKHWCDCCIKFAGLNLFPNGPRICPCFRFTSLGLTRDEIAKQTWLLLEEKGYI